MRNPFTIAAAILTVVFASIVVSFQVREPEKTFDDVIAMAQHEPCTELDYVGDLRSPESIILKCTDGDSVTVDAPFDRELFATSSEGKHFVYAVTITDDGEYRVWYDDSLTTHERNAVVTITKVTGRNFSQTTASWSQGWK